MASSSSSSSSSPLFPPTRRLASLVAALSSVPAPALPKLSLALARVATHVVGCPAGARAFSDDEEAQLVALLADRNF